MPVRLLDSPVLKWPDHDTVHSAVRQWAQSVARSLAAEIEVIAIGYFGSYARGDWGPGSDVDIMIITAQQPAHDPHRHYSPVDWETWGLPVPADVLVYAADEWARLGGKMGKVLREETVWVYGCPPV
ncbi:MAG: nucleotidyltransferase domain-containing protein [Chloroflexi bacterium]|nr:nucleotidyltransferase domain-containing protein [Chloroflexota bacterium]